MTGRHEIPTHLGVADRAVLGLTMRQLLSAACGLALAYAAAGDLPLPLVLRLGAAALVLAATLPLVFWRPQGRPLEEWAFVLLRYRAAPRAAAWRPRERPVLPRAAREVVLRPLAAPPPPPAAGEGGGHAAAS
ncbi:MAG: PrgI family protein [Chloroflexi bacterium]|nr:PrgI family protein [Chloroflexota bacterium]